MIEHYALHARVKKCHMAALIMMNDSGTSAHFTPFESDFVSMTQGNYSCIETANSKVPLFMVTVATVLIEHEIIDPKDRTTRTAISKLWPVYCVPGMTMHLLSTGQLL